MNLVSLLLQMVIIMESNELKKMAELAIKTSKDLNENFDSIIEELISFLSCSSSENRFKYLYLCSIRSQTEAIKRKTLEIASLSTAIYEHVNKEMEKLEKEV